MNRFIAAALGNIKFPEPVAKEFVNSLSGQYSNALAENTSLGDLSTSLWKHKLSVSAAQALIGQGRPSSLDAMLETREHRDTIMDIVLHFWDLTAEDQSRLASRALSSKAAKYILQSEEYTDAAKAIASTRAEPDDHLSWLANCSLSDDDVLAHLIKSAKRQTPPVTPVLSLLIARPALRATAVTSDIEFLYRPMCWVPVEAPEHQQQLAERVMGMTPGNATSHPAFGLLGQPNLDPEVRSTLWDWVEEKDMVPAAFRAGVRSSSSPLNTGTSLRLEENVKVINMHLDNLSMPRTDSWHRVAAAAQLIELSWNQSLDRDQKVRLLHHLSAYRGELHGVAATPIDARLFSMVAELAPDEDPMRTLAYSYQVGYECRNEQERRARRANTLEVVAARTESTSARSGMYRRYYGYDGDHSAEELLTMGARELANRPARLETLSDTFVELLGDGSTPESLRAWTTTIHMAAEQEGVPLGKIIDTAKKMAAIDT